MSDQADKAGPKPSVPYSHLYVDADGISHQSRCALTDYELKAVGPADPQWNDKMERGEATVVFTVQPVGWVGDWHENPAPQWIIVLSGRWWIESMDGTRIEQGPGDFSFGEDQGCTETDGKKGHRSGTIGDQPCCLMTVQLHVDPKRRAMSPDMIFRAIAGFRLVTADARTVGRLLSSDRFRRRRGGAHSRCGHETARPRRRRFAHRDVARPKPRGSRKLRPSGSPLSG